MFHLSSILLDEAQKILLEFRWDPPVYELAVKAMETFREEEGVQSAACGILEALCSSGMSMLECCLPTTERGFPYLMKRTFPASRFVVCNLTKRTPMPEQLVLERSHQKKSSGVSSIAEFAFIAEVWCFVELSELGG